MTDDPKPPPQPPERSEAERQKTSGRISFDKRGNPVWEWALKTGIFGRDIDTKRLRALEAKDLKLIEEPNKEKAAHRASRPSAGSASALRPVKDAGGGMNPYDNVTRPQPKVSHPAMRQSPSSPGAEPKSAPEFEPGPRNSAWTRLKKLFSRKED